MMGSIKEEDEVDEEEEIEKQAGSTLDLAEGYIKDFEKSVIELVPTVRGELLAQAEKKK